MLTRRLAAIRCVAVPLPYSTYAALPLTQPCLPCPLSGNRRLGMAALDHNHELCEVACEAEITECHPQVDGRFYIEVVGRRRFKPTEVWEQVGYHMACAALSQCVLDAKQLGSSCCLGPVWLWQTHRAACTATYRCRCSPHHF